MPLCGPITRVFWNGQPWSGRQLGRIFRGQRYRPVVGVRGRRALIVPDAGSIVLWSVWCRREAADSPKCSQPHGRLPFKGRGGGDCGRYDGGRVSSVCRVLWPADRRRSLKRRSNIRRRWRNGAHGWRTDRCSPGP